jgi:histidyl-tRNA synthetase
MTHKTQSKSAQATKKKTEEQYWLYPDITKAFEIALYYSFTPHTIPQIEKVDREAVKNLTTEGEDSFFILEEKAALLRTLSENGQIHNPVMIARVDHIHKNSKTRTFTLDVIGTQRAIADATLIKAAYEIARNEGYDTCELELNSIGDRESFARYTRELNSFFRKNINDLCAECRMQIKKDIYKALTCTNSECSEILGRAPHSMNYLSEPSRAYFSELLEMLEVSEIPYTINNSIICNYEVAMHAAFSIISREHVGALLRKKWVSKKIFRA